MQPFQAHYAWNALLALDFSHGCPINLSGPTEFSQTKQLFNLSSAQLTPNSTKEMYSSGLLLFHTYCNQISLPESEHTLADQNLITDFTASMIGIVSSSTISNYLAGLCAWHLIHSISWQVNYNELQLLMCAAECNNPTLKKPPCLPVAIQFICAIKPHIQPGSFLNIAIFTCLTLSFYTTC